MEVGLENIIANCSSAYEVNIRSFRFESSKQDGNNNQNKIKN